jgi:transposase-like protein
MSEEEFYKLFFIAYAAKIHFAARDVLVNGMPKAEAAKKHGSHRQAVYKCVQTMIDRTQTQKTEDSDNRQTS